MIEENQEQSQGKPFPEMCEVKYIIYRYVQQDSMSTICCSEHARDHTYTFTEYSAKNVTKSDVL